jgi:hypothetical protein
MSFKNLLLKYLNVSNLSVFACTSQAVLFSNSRSAKNLQTIHCVFRFRSAERIAHHFQWIFPSNRSAPASRKKDFHTNRPPCPKNLGIVKVFVVSGLKLETLINSYQNLRLNLMQLIIFAIQYCSTNVRADGRQSL